MIVKIMALILCLIILLLLILFSETLKIHVKLKNINNRIFGHLYIQYYNIKIDINPEEKDITIQLKIRNHTKTLHKFNMTTDTDTEESYDNENEDEEKTAITTIIKQIHSSKIELIHLTELAINIIKFNKSTIILALGLSDNNLTIKTCTQIWKIAALLYPLKIEIILTPLINELKIESDTDLSFEIDLINTLKLVIYTLTNKKLRTLIKTIYENVG
ncbi:MAG: hypothetical protein BZ136_02780 [Methanosphaera sp. rholeuAM74]|nr:MAG: hypothetical protein BZ136_02780 [Methanosphaera sp. rholeuAM74]